MKKGKEIWVVERQILLDDWVPIGMAVERQAAENAKIDLIVKSKFMYRVRCYVPKRGKRGTAQ